MPIDFVNRTGKVSDGVTTEYLLVGINILLENRGGNIISSYDANGTRLTFKYDRRFGRIYLCSRI